MYIRTSWKLSLFKHIYYYETYIISCAYVHTYVYIVCVCVCVCVCVRVCVRVCPHLENGCCMTEAVVCMVRLWPNTDCIAVDACKGKHGWGEGLHSKSTTRGP